MEAFVPMWLQQNNLAAENILVVVNSPIVVVELPMEHSVLASLLVPFCCLFLDMSVHLVLDM